jgi:GNAT superfamily N-acetyltransferase
MVRPRRADDLERLIAVLRRVHKLDGYPANWPNDPIRWLGEGRTIGAWVSEQGGELVGHLALTPPDPDRSWPEWQEGHVPRERLVVMRRLFVAPEQRRLGIATRLMRVAVGEAAAQQLHPVLDVSDDNEGAIAFWQAHGWREVGKASLPPGDEGRALRLLLLAAPRRPSLTPDQRLVRTDRPGKS